MKLLTLGLATATAFGFANSIPLGTAAELEGPRALAIELGAPFHDHAVLQRGMTVPVWGWSKPGTKVTVAFAGQKDADIPLIYTVPGKSLAPRITRPGGINGQSTAVERNDWRDLGGVFEAVAKWHGKMPAVFLNRPEARNHS